MNAHERIGGKGGNESLKKLTAGAEKIKFNYTLTCRFPEQVHVDGGVSRLLGLEKKILVSGQKEFEK